MRDPARPSYEFGPFRLDLSEHLLLRKGQPVPLTPKNFEVLRVLVQNAGHLVERDGLLQEVWPDTFVEEGALSRSVFVLRKALGEEPEVHRYIETVPKLGYRFLAPVTEVRPDGLEPNPENGSGVPPERGTAGTEVAAPREPIAVPRHRIRYGTRLAMAGGLLAVGAVTFAVLGPMGSGRAVTQQLAPAHGPVTFTGREGAPALSPDGDRLAYVSNESATRTLMVQSLNGWPAPGEQPVPVFSAPEIGHLRWSPDGSELLVWARGPEHNGVYALARMGGAPRLIAARQYVACWSPDGSTVAVGSHLDGTIRILDGLGREQRTISLEGVHWSIWDLGSAATNRLVVVSNDYQGRYTIWSVQAGRYRSAAHDLGESGDLLGALGAGRERRLLPAAREPGGRAAEAGAVTWRRGHRQDDLGGLETIGSSTCRETADGSPTSARRFTPISGPSMSARKAIPPRSKQLS